MYAFLVTAVLGIVPCAPIVDDVADVVEVNHYFDENGKLVCDQVIFWRWHNELEGFHVVAWRFLKTADQWPRRDLRRGGFVTVWQDSKVFRRVRAATMSETWTLYDPEVQDRDAVPKCRRPGLSDEPTRERIER